MGLSELILERLFWFSDGCDSLLGRVFFVDLASQKFEESFFLSGVSTLSCPLLLHLVVDVEHSEAREDQRYEEDNDLECYVLSLLQLKLPLGACRCWCSYRLLYFWRRRVGIHGLARLVLGRSLSNKLARCYVNSKIDMFEKRVVLSGGVRPECRMFLLEFVV